MTWTVGALSLGVFTQALGSGPSVPWPLGVPPTETELLAAVSDAEELVALERFEEFLEAYEQGEQREHILVLQSDVDAGKYSVDDLFNLGDSLFEHEFTAIDGHGDVRGPGLRRVHGAERGGLDTFSCAGCHSVGGANGAGHVTQNAMLHGDGDRLSSTVVRNPPSVLGMGMVQSLGAEMTVELQYQRRRALEQSEADGAPVRAPLSSHGVTFGAVTAHPDGSVDTSEVEGIDPDLVVRPFGWKGDVARLRRFLENAARVHLGVQSHVLAEGHRDAPNPVVLGDGERWWDPDDDRATRELPEGSLTSGAIYLALLEAPIILPPAGEHLRGMWAKGEQVFAEVGCADCHRPHLPLLTRPWTETPDTTEGAGVRFNVLVDGNQPKGSDLVRLYSDLKRHAMGPGLADPHDHPSGIPKDVFLTRPLWGLADTAPYMHDGRALTIPEAILEHGGEAQAARDAFAALPDEKQRELHVFLLSLTRTPTLRIPR